MWEHGKRVTWFEDEEVNKINAGTYDIASRFKDVASINDYAEGSTFNKPTNLEEELRKIVVKLDIGGEPMFSAK